MFKKKRRRRGGYCQELLQQSMHRLQFFLQANFRRRGLVKSEHLPRAGLIVNDDTVWGCFFFLEKKWSCRKGRKNVELECGRWVQERQVKKMLDRWYEPGLEKVFSVNEWVKERKKNLHFLAKQKNLNRKLEKCSCCCCYCGRTVTQVL